MYIDVANKISFTYLLDYSDELIVAVDTEGSIILFNKAAEEFFHQERNYFIGRNLIDVKQELDLHDGFTIQKKLGQKDKLEKKYVVNGQDYFIDWTVIPIQIEGFSGCLFKGEDSTQMKSTLEKIEMLDNIIRYAPDMIYWKDKDSRHLGCNEQFALAAGFKDRSEVIGKSDCDFPWYSEANKYNGDDKFVIESGQPKLNIEDFMPYSNGKQATVITNKVPLRGLNGDIIGVLGIATDITQQKKVEQALSLAKEEAEAANYAKIEFIANMSHDIRTPLTGVVGMSKILEEAIVDPKQKNYARWLGESGDQLLKMLNEVLDIVSADNLKTVDNRKVVFNLETLVNDIIELEQPSTQLKGLKLVANIDDMLPRVLICDQTKLHRILLNLLGNAIKFTQRGQVELRVNLVKKTTKKVILRFSVADTGIGIPEELHDKVFDRFFRITPSYKGVYTGSGVGLHIAQSYAQLLGSRINVSSEVGIGTTFYFDLSLEIADEGASPVEGSSRLTNSSFVTGLGLVNAGDVADDAPIFLLVEDNNIARLMLESLVSQAGYRFRSVTDGESALDLAKSMHFDLVITDLGLPGVSGIDFTKKLREYENINDKPAIPIIGLTAHADPQIKKGCIIAGMNEAFTKPMSPAILDNIKVNYFSSFHSSLESGRLAGSKSASNLGLDLPNTEKELFELETLAILDTNKALGAIGNNMDLLKSILKSMLEEELPNDIDEIKSLHASDDWTGVEKIAHRLKGGLVYCGADRLACACQYLERYKKAGLTAMLDKLYLQLLIVADETLLAIKKWLN